MKESRLDIKSLAIGKRPLFFAALYVLAGILLAEYSGAGLLYPLICAAVCLLFFVFFRKFKYAGAFILVAVMLLSCAYHTAYTKLPISNFEELNEVDIVGRVDEAKYSDNSDTYLLTDVSINGEHINKNIFLSTRHTGYEVDDYITAKGELKLPASASYEHSFDYRRYCLSKNAAYISLSYETTFLSKADDLKAAINDLRNMIADKIDELYGSDAPIVKAFTVGMDEDIEQALYDDYRNTGISHVLVMSGLHVGFIYLAIDALLKRLKTNRIVRLIINLLSILLVMTLAGFGVSVMRAGIMCIISTIGVFLGRRTDTLTALSIAFLICVIINPASVFSASLQLSFGAVFGIVTVTKTLNNRIKFIKSGFIKEMLFTSLGATLGTMPILISMNGSFYFPSVLINMLVVPFVSVMIPFSFIVTLIYCIFGGVTAYIAIPVRLMITALNGVSSLSSLSDFGLVHFFAVSEIGIISFYILLFIASDYVGARWRYKLIAVSVFALLIAGSYIYELPNGDSEITFVDAGNSDLAVITSGEDVLVIDTGKDEETAVNYLNSKGLVPDAVLITAADERKLGGLAKIAERYPNCEIVIPESVSDELIISGFEYLDASKLKAGEFIIELTEQETGLRAEVFLDDTSLCVFLEDNATELPETQIIKTYKRGKRQKYSQKEVFESGAGYAIISSSSDVSDDTAVLLEGLTVINTYTSGSITVSVNNGLEVSSVYEG